MGGGSGSKPGTGGQGYAGIEGQDGSLDSGGEAYDLAGAGGAPGQPGEAGAYGGGLAGKVIEANGSTVNIYTNGDLTRYIQGEGDTPNSIS